MCKVLQIPRNIYYDEAKMLQTENNIKSDIREIFKLSNSQNAKELMKLSKIISRRRIGPIMNERAKSVWYLLILLRNSNHIPVARMNQSKK